VIPGGLYAVFLHKGTATQAATTYQYIFGTWLPNADYLLDDSRTWRLWVQNIKTTIPIPKKHYGYPSGPKESQPAIKTSFSLKRLASTNFFKTPCCRNHP
jgi:AraC family transcriptional regulator